MTKFVYVSMKLISVIFHMKSINPYKNNRILHALFHVKDTGYLFFLYDQLDGLWIGSH